MAAINAGADAIYYGGIDFNARHSAKNLSRHEMGQIAKICKLYQVKNYIVLNTLIKDSEWQTLIETLNFYQSLDLDGLIIQDLGLVYLLQKYYHFPLQTSTQMSVYGLEGVLFFQELGFDRLVCPREMSLEEIASIKAVTTIPLKTFVHGALCYAYSGQCLLSSAIGDRSGNRGRCAQPCRKTYQLLSQDGRLIEQGFLLSPKDLNTVKDLQAISDSGVDALKIEGRMKTPEYVFAVTKAYRQGLDQVFADSPQPPSIKESELMQVFNRDFTRGHLMNDARILNPQVGKNRGIKIGQVGLIAKKMSGYFNLPIKLDAGIVIAIGDGLSFGQDASQGTRVDRIFAKDGQSLETSDGHEEIAIPYKGVLEAGMVVFRNLDGQLMTRLRQEALAPLVMTKSEINMTVTIAKDQPARVEVRDGLKTMVYQSEFYPAKAQKNPLDEELISKQFRRLGDTDFALGELLIFCDPGLFLAKSQLNSLRSESLQAFEEFGKRLECKIDLDHELIGTLSKGQEVLGPQILSLEFSNLPADDYLEELAQKNLNSITYEWVFPLKLDGQDKPVFKKIKKWRARGILVKVLLPRIMTNQMVANLKLLRDAKKIQAIDGVVVSNYEALYCLRHEGINLEANASFNVFNSLALKTLKKWGLEAAVLSLELDKEAIIKMGAAQILPLTLAVYGYQEVMVSKKCLLNCPDCPEKKLGKSCLKTFEGYLRDEQTFPVRRDDQGLTHIYTESPLFLKDDIFDLKGVSRLRLYHYTESRAIFSDLVDYYSKKMINEETRKRPQKENWGRFKRGVK